MLEKILLKVRINMRYETITLSFKIPICKC